MPVRVTTPIRVVAFSLRNGFPTHTSLWAKGFPIGREPTDHFKEDAMLKKAGIGLAGLALAAGLATAASAHMRGGSHHDRRDYDTRSGWYCGMSHSGYCCDGPGWRTSGYTANLLALDAAQKVVEDFARKSFPGYRVGKVEKDNPGRRPLYTTSLTGNDSRFEVQVDAVDGRILGVYPIEE